MAFGKRRCGSGCFGLYPRACSGYRVFSALRCGSTRGERRPLPGRHRVGADLATGPARIPRRQCCSVGARRTDDAEGLGRAGGGQSGDECSRSCRFGSVTHLPAGQGLCEQSLRQAPGLGNASRSATGDDAVTLRGVPDRNPNIALVTVRRRRVERAGFVTLREARGHGVSSRSAPRPRARTMKGPRISARAT